MARRRWLPAAVALAAGAVLAVDLLLPPALRGRLGGGAAYVFATYAQALSIAGLGLALARLPRRPAAAAVLLFAAGILAGLMLKDRALSALVQRADAFDQTVLIGPAACILSGIAIVLPGRARGLVAPGIALLAGIAIGFLAALNDPTFGESQFAAGAAAAALWLLLAPLAFVPRLGAAPVAVGARIVASWLVAIGVMLGAATLLGRPPAAPPPGAIDLPRP